MTAFNLTLCLLICLLTSSVAFSQQEFSSVDAHSQALSGSSVTFSDNWSTFHNQAGLGFLEHPSLGVYAENRYGLKELNAGALSIALPLGSYGTFGLSYYMFNNSVIFNRQKVGFAYSKKLTPVFSAGIQLSLIITHLQDYDNNYSYCGELGILYKPSGKWKVGVHIFNPSYARFTSYEDEHIPTCIRLGASYSIDDNATLFAEIENGTYTSLVLKGGLEYKLSPRVALQAGMHSNPTVNSFGLTYEGKNFRINIAFLYHQQLGGTPGLSMDKSFFAK
jgi:hypothetical protein